MHWWNVTVLWLLSSLSATASSRWGNYIKSVGLLVKKSPSAWSRHLYSAESTTATVHLHTFLSELSVRCGVYRTPMLVVSLLTRERSHHSGSQTLTLAAYKITDYLQTVPPDHCTLFTPTRDLTTWLRWFNQLQHAHHGLASSLPVTSHSGS